MALPSAPPLEDLLGTRFTLLDSIRDSTFLGTPGSPGTDFGLGILDNPLFFFTTYYEPGSSTPRQYPTKLFWMGSPQGTNDRTDAFSLYVADVVGDNFAPGVVPGGASSWLVNPRLVLSIQQAKSDIVGWFDSNYPGGASGGVGASNSGQNGTYGALAGGSSAVGDISGAGSIDGQFWPIYDYVDNTVLFYFSVKTPNANTLSIYCYKIADSEFSAPASSSEFLGGLYAPGWTSLIPTFTAGGNVMSSHRFSLLSPDPLAVQPKLPGTQNAVFMYAYGVIDGVTPDHGRLAAGSILSDIHTNPLNPGVVTQTHTTAYSIISEIYYTPDKLGSLFAANALAAPSPGYVCIYNTPMQIDRRYGSMVPPSGYSKSNVYISAMQLRVMYYNPVSGIGFGSEPLRMTQSPSVIGTCRPQFTDLPDGKTKILYANFSWDQYLNLAYEYMRPTALSPDRHRKIQLLFTRQGPSACYTYGKKKLLVRARLYNSGGGLTVSNDLAANQNIIQFIGGVNADTTNGTAWGSAPDIGSKYVHVSRVFGMDPYSDRGPVATTEVSIEDTDDWVLITPIGPGLSPNYEVTLSDE